MKCIQCGKQIEQEHAVLCEDCFRKKHTCLKSYQEHTLLLCQNCGSYKYQKQWKLKKPKEDAAKEAVLHSCDFLLQPEAVDLHFKWEKEDHTVQKGMAILQTETLIEGQKCVEEFEFPVRIKKALCDVCARVKTAYFEGILQLRGENKKTLEKAHQFILDEAENAKRKGIFITKMEEVKNGIDYYYTKQQYLPAIMNKLIEKFGAEGKTHAELFSKSRETSKDIYRVNASVRLPHYEKGSVIEYKRKDTKSNDETRILQITGIGKYITARDLRSDKIARIEDKEHITVAALPDDFKTVQVTKWYPEIEVLHPETFENVPVENQTKLPKEKKEVVVAIIEGKVWLVDFKDS